VSADNFTPHGGRHAVDDDERRPALSLVPPLTARERMSMLAISFPELELRARSAILPFDALELNRWARSGAPGHGGMCAARFVLSVWDPGTKWRAGRFDIHEALSIWDDAHRRAFLAWCINPWWP